MKYKKSEAKEAARAQFRGVWAALTTPFTPQGELDEPGLRRNMRYCTDGLHVDGVFCTGLVGEYWALTKEERQRVVEVVVEEARDKCLVIAHTTHHSAAETVELTRHAEEVGADFAIILNPCYPPVSEAMIYEWFSFVSKRSNIGIWMFDTEHAGYSVAFSAELTDKLADLENICGIKIARSMSHYARIKQLCGDRLVMSHPSEADWLSLMRDHGQRVHMSSPSPFLMQTPGWTPLREYTELGLQGDFERAAQVSRQLDSLRELYRTWIQSRWVRQGLITVEYMKAWSELLGMAAGPVRPPILRIKDEERQALAADLEKVGVLARAATP